MLKSALRYLKFFIVTGFRPERRLLFANLWQKHHYKGIGKLADGDRKAAMQKAVDWLLIAQKATIDNGFCSYHLVNGWSSSYPETTGYIIPTLLQFNRKNARPELENAVLKAADFLVGIQRPSGGWQGGRVNENRPEIVFNTGQVIRGMLAAFKLTDEKKFLNAAIKAGEWLVAIQDPLGFWKTNALLEQARVYDTFVDVPLLKLYEVTGESSFRMAAVRNLDWVINRKMKSNGWFEDCDNTIKHNDRPILHTIAYTLDGLIDSGLILNEKKYVDGALKGATVLRDLFVKDGILNGRYDQNWQGSEYFICTGGAQMASVWMKLYREGYGDEFLTAAQQMVRLLIFIQNRTANEREVTRGAIPGSFPIWGRYEPFAFPNWATKFFLDALMMEEEIG